MNLNVKLNTFKSFAKVISKRHDDQGTHVSQLEMKGLVLKGGSSGKEVDDVGVLFVEVEPSVAGDSFPCSLVEEVGVFVGDGSETHTLSSLCVSGGGVQDTSHKEEAQEVGHSEGCRYEKASGVVSCAASGCCVCSTCGESFAERGRKHVSWCCCNGKVQEATIQGVWVASLQ